MPGKNKLKNRQRKNTKSRKGKRRKEALRQRALKFQKEKNELRALDDRPNDLGQVPLDQIGSDESLQASPEQLERKAIVPEVPDGFEDFQVMVESKEEQEIQLSKYGLSGVYKNQ